MSETRKWAKTTFLTTQLRQRPAADKGRLLRTALELRGRGLSYESICVVLELYEGLDLTVYQLRYWLYANGVPKDEAKRRASKRSFDAGIGIGQNVRRRSDSVRRAA